MTLRPAAFAIPGDIDTRTGGFITTAPTGIVAMTRIAVSQCSARAKGR